MVTFQFWRHLGFGLVWSGLVWSGLVWSGLGFRMVYRGYNLVQDLEFLVIRDDLLDFSFNLDFYFEDIFSFGNILVLVTFQL